MSMTRDWLSHTREGQLAMARDWISVVGAPGSALGVPGPVMLELQNLMQAAEADLNTAQNETTRTPVSTARCRASFEALAAKMRDIKKRYFLSPPLVDADYISLGSPGDAANKGCRIWYTVTAPEEAPPENPEDLRWSYYIKEVLSA